MTKVGRLAPTPFEEAPYVIVDIREGKFHFDKFGGQTHLYIPKAIVEIMSLEVIKRLAESETIYGKALDWKVDDYEHSVALILPPQKRKGMYRDDNDMRVEQLVVSIEEHILYVEYNAVLAELRDMEQKARYTEKEKPQLPPDQNPGKANEIGIFTGFNGQRGIGEFCFGIKDPESGYLYIPQDYFNDMIKKVRELLRIRQEIASTTNEKKYEAP